MSVDLDRKRVNTSARIIGLWVGISSAIVIAAGVGALVAIILRHSRGHSDSHGDDDRRPDRIVIDVDDVVKWILVFGFVAVVSLSLIAWATARRAVLPLAEALTAQRAFVADASHELRTPLATVGSRVQILERRLARGEAVEGVVAELRRDTDAMGELLSDLLMEAQFENRDAPMPPTDLRVPLEETVAKLSPLAASRRIELRTTYYAKNAPITVPVSHVALSRLFLAILDNAIEHNRDGAAVTIDVVVYSQHVEVRVSDQGPGIAAADTERIFERFARGPETGRRRGYGLGLFLARSIAERGGGSLGVERSSPEGSVFLLQLPRLTSPATALPDSSSLR